MLTSKTLKVGIINGTIYDFPEVGDILPMHSHIESNSHITIVARGSFTANLSEQTMTLNCGDVINWPANQAHEFVALELNSRLVNIVKGAA
jgi:quercetin dioxygenase-like cupin family protein